jgi:hypothetical protein
MTIKSHLTKLLRLAEITSGYAVLDEKGIYRFDPNPKLETLVEIVKEYLEENPTSKVLIWAYFNENIKQIEHKNYECILNGLLTKSFESNLDFELEIKIFKKDFLALKNREMDLYLKQKNNKKLLEEAENKYNDRLNYYKCFKQISTQDILNKKEFKNYSEITLNDYKPVSKGTTLDVIVNISITNTNLAPESLILQQVKAFLQEIYVQFENTGVSNKDLYTKTSLVDSNKFALSDYGAQNIKKNYSIGRVVYTYNENNFNNSCESMEVNKLQLKEDILNQIINEFDEKYNLSKKELEENLEKNFLYYSTNFFPKLLKIEKDMFLQYNNQRYELGLKNSEESKVTLISPYALLRDIILGQQDFVKKQNDIIKDNGDLN